MALHTAKISEIPPGNVVLTKRGAVKFQLSLMETLVEKKDRLFIDHGAALAAACTFITCSYIKNFYRQSVNLGKKGLLRTSGVALLLPAFLNYGVHQRFIRDNIIVQKWTCPLCYHIRSSCFQVLLGAVYPVIVGSVAAFSTARYHNLYDVPPLNRKPIINFFLNKSKPLQRFGFLIVLFHAVLGYTISEKEASEINYFNSNIETFISNYDAKLKLSMQLKE